MSLTTTGLTTVFTPAAGCATIFTYEPEGYNLVSGGLLIQDILDYHPETQSCFPTGWKGFGRGGLKQVFSPAVCPVGYTTATSGINGAVSNAICCPSSFSYYTTYSIFPNILGSTNGALFAGCLSMFPSTAGYTTVLGRSGASDLSTTSVSGPLTMWAQPWSVEYKQADLALFTTTSSSISTASSTATASASLTAPTASSTSGSTASSASSSSSNSSSSTGISGGAIAGIVIGAAAVIGLIIGIALFLAIRRRKAGNTAGGYQAGSGEQNGTSHYWAAGVDGDDDNGKRNGGVENKPVFEVDSQQQSSASSHSQRAPTEMDAERARAELDAQRSPVEMAQRDVYEMQ